MTWNISIELPDDVSSQVLDSIAKRHKIELSAKPTEAQINQVSQVVALEIYEKEKLNLAQAAADAAFKNVIDNS